MGHSVAIAATSMLPPSLKIITDTTYLVAQFNNLEQKIKAMSNKINNLEKEISTLTKTTPSSKMFICDECGYEANTETV